MPTYKLYGERAILIEWPKKIDKSILQDVVSFKGKLRNFYNKDIVHINSAYNSILVSYNFIIQNFDDTIEELDSIYDSEADTKKVKPKLWKIPVCYDLKFGLDLEELSNDSGMTSGDIIKAHSNTVYTVYFIGFLPGFLYLGGLNEAIYFPRKEKPRLKIDKGAVAIGGKQTGVYPNESPGGWNIIGNTPISLFDITQVEPCFAKSGDKIKFIPITVEEHEIIKNAIKDEQYQLESEVING